MTRVPPSIHLGKTSVRLLNRRPCSMTRSVSVVRCQNGSTLAATVEHRCHLQLARDTTYLALTDVQHSVSYEHFGNNRSCYIGTTLYEHLIGNAARYEIGLGLFVMMTHSGRCKNVLLVNTSKLTSWRLVIPVDIKTEFGNKTKSKKMTLSRMEVLLLCLQWGIGRNINGPMYFRILKQSLKEFSTCYWQQSKKITR